MLFLVSFICWDFYFGDIVCVYNGCLKDGMNEVNLYLYICM